ncbi:MAG: hypothetical protein DMF57_00870 [Acidobacteria bacterium]|nr:MAG: hypothetical protein DMF57_00870 [Acidobacteriota bacterium]
MRLQAALIMAALFAAEAPAQVARIFLSGTGNDANDCSNAATPCRSLQGAINQSPVSGEIMVMTSGGYGTATINKSLVINAPDGVVAFNARTITVSIATGDKVVIRGLSLNGSVFADPNGIDFTGSTGGTLVVENTVIAGFTQGINQAAATLFVRNCEFRTNDYGILATGGDVTVENCRFEKNAYGVSVQNGAKGVVRDSVAVGFFSQGIAYDADETNGASTTLIVDNCAAEDNQVGLNVHGPTAAIRATNSTITNNFIGLGFSGGTITSYGTNQLWNNGTDGTFSSTIAQQ